MSDSEQCSNRLEVDLISLLVKVDLISFLVNFLVNIIMTSCGLDERFLAMFEPTSTLPNFTFGLDEQT